MVNPRAKEDISEEYASNLVYWRQQLEDAPTLEILPGIYSPSEIKPVGQGCIDFALSRQLCDNLITMCDQFSTSPAAIFLTVFNVLLHRYTAQTNIVIGIPVYTGNNHEAGSPEEDIVVLPFRTDLSGDPGFRQLLARVSITLEAAVKHRKIRSEDLREIVSRDAEAGGFFKTIFSFKNNVSEQPKPCPGISGVATLDAIPEKFDLLLSMENNASGITGFFTFNAQLYDEAFVVSMSEHFKILLDGIIANPERNIGYLPLLTAAELFQLTVKWNDTDSEYPHTKCLHQLFEEQVLRSPGAIAVQLHEKLRTSFFSKVKRELTFQELDSRANQLANYLKHHGVGPEVIVGIFMKRSIEMMVGIMGILKAGGAYLPMDPSQPKGRVDFMLKDSGIQVLLTQYQLMQKLPPHDIEVVCLDAEWNKVASYSDQAPVTVATPTNLAYLIYTSGSTGKPKGTLVIHKGVVNYICWCRKAYAVERGIGAPVNTSPGFDATVTSLLSPLCAGKKAFLLPEEDEIEILGEAFNSDQQFSLVKITPAHLSILNRQGSYTGLQNKSTAIVIGGEALNSEAIQQLRKQAPTVRIFNEYGPTETVVGCTVYEVGPGYTLSGDLPIGRPISNTRIYILDERLQHVPIGTAGEIFIGGDGVARGYLNRPELTAERFIPDPFSGIPGARLYRTGDIARYLKDGHILFSGRRDNQVKISGYRIELAEIISVLRQYPGLQDTIVIVEEIPGNDKRLVAYLVLKDQTAFDTSDIRTFLAARLPEYMIPAVFVSLEALPLTINGKVDKAALPPPDHNRPALEKAYKAPETNLEKELLLLFEQVLHINRVGVNDNLFELGIHSLQVYWVFAQIKKTTGIQLPLSILFQYPTAEKLAAYLEKMDCNDLWSSLVPIQPNGSKLPIFCIHGGGGTVLFYRDLAQHLGDDQPVYGLQPQGLDGKQPFHKSIRQMATHYIKEIQSINPTGPYLLAGYCFGAVVAFEMAQQLQPGGFKVSLLVSLNGVSPTYTEAAAVKQKDLLPAGSDLPRISKANYSMVKFSWQYFKEQSLRNKISYLARKLAHKFLTIAKYKVLGKIRRGYTQAVYLSCQKFNLKCPESLRKFYFLSTNTKMVNDYKPKNYQGNLTIFRSPGLYPDPHIGWTNFVAGEIRTVDIPGKHKDRRQILNEPFVQLTAEALKSEIEKCSSHTPSC